MLNRLFEFMEISKIHNLIAANHFHTLTRTASAWQLCKAGKRKDALQSTLYRLIDAVESAHELTQGLIQAQQYCVFSIAAGLGDITLMNRLIALVDQATLQKMIEAYRYCAFRLATDSGQLDAVNRLMELVRADHLFKMLNVDTDWGLIHARSNGHQHIISRLLNVPEYFAYVERHGIEFAKNYIDPFIHEKLLALQERQDVLKQQDPTIVFNVLGDDEIKICFYIIRYLIRQKDLSRLVSLRFLLDIPAISAVAHQALTPSQPNELVRLALVRDYKEAAAYLMKIPAVNGLAQANDYYQDEMRGELNLRALAIDSHSSTLPLTVREEHRLKELYDHYKPLIDEHGVELLMAELRKELIQVYNQNPAKVVITNDKEAEKILFLPVDMDSLLASLKSPELKEQVFQAYYQHKIHTALRFVSNPNPWLWREAEYVIRQPSRPDLCCSHFLDFQDLIVLLWQASKDTAFPPSDGYDVEGRRQLFFEELALTGRAQNCTKMHIKMDAMGHPVLDSDKNPIQEEVDDFKEGDDPSCPSGIKRRLFQSVLSHPLLKIVTRDHIAQQINSFVFNHFKLLINEHTRIPLLSAWVRYTSSPNPNDSKILQRLNIPTEKQQEWFESLVKQYGHKFSEDAGLVHVFTNAFKLTNVETDAHALNFGHIGLLKLLSTATAGTSTPAFQRQASASLSELASFYPLVRQHGVAGGEAEASGPLPQTALFHPLVRQPGVGGDGAQASKSGSMCVTVAMKTFPTLTPEELNQKINDFVYRHFEKIITDKKRSRLSQAWSRYNTQPTAKDIDILRDLNISREKQDELYLLLVEQYGPSVKMDAIKMRFINKTNEFHAKKFEHVGLQRLLEEPKVTPKRPLSPKFFVPSSLAMASVFDKTESVKESDAKYMKP